MLTSDGINSSDLYMPHFKQAYKHTNLIITVGMFIDIPITPIHFQTLHKVLTCLVTAKTESGQTCSIYE